VKEFSNKELSVLKYFDNEYGDTIDVYFIPGSYGAFYLMNPIKWIEMGRLFFNTDGTSKISYNDDKNKQIIHQLFSSGVGDISKLFEDWLLLKFKCSSIEEFRNKIDNEPFKPLPEIR